MLLGRTTADLTPPMSQLSFSPCPAVARRLQPLKIGVSACFCVASVAHSINSSVDRPTRSFSQQKNTIDSSVLKVCLHAAACANAS